MELLKDSLTNQGVTVLDDLRYKELIIDRCNNIAKILTDTVVILMIPDTVDLEKRKTLLIETEAKFNLAMAVNPSDYLKFIPMYLRMLIDKLDQEIEKKLEDEKKLLQLKLDKENKLLQLKLDNENKLLQLKLNKEMNTKKEGVENNVAYKKIVITKNPRKTIHDLAMRLKNAINSDPDCLFLGDNNSIAIMIQRVVVDKDGKQYEISTIYQYISDPKTDEVKH